MTTGVHGEREQKKVEEEDVIEVEGNQEGAHKVEHKEEDMEKTTEKGELRQEHRRR